MIRIDRNSHFWLAITLSESVSLLRFELIPAGPTKYLVKLDSVGQVNSRLKLRPTAPTARVNTSVDTPPVVLWIKHALKPQPACTNIALSSSWKNTSFPSPPKVCKPARASLFVQWFSLWDSLHKCNLSCPLPRKIHDRRSLLVSCHGMI